MCLLWKQIRRCHGVCGTKPDQRLWILIILETKDWDHYLTSRSRGLGLSLIFHGTDWSISINGPLCSVKWEIQPHISWTAKLCKHPKSSVWPLDYMSISWLPSSSSLLMRLVVIMKCTCMHWRQWLPYINEYQTQIKTCDFPLPFKSHKVIVHVTLISIIHKQCCFRTG